MKLTTKKAQNLAKKYLLDKKIKDGEFFYIHTKGVAKSAKLLAKKENLDENFFEIIAWVHDIGYSVDSKSHANHTLKILKKEDFEVNNIMKDMILNHGSLGNPETKEGKLMQIADKISIIDRDFLEVLLDNKINDEEIKFMKSMFNICIKNLEKLK